MKMKTFFEYPTSAILLCAILYLPSCASIHRHDDVTMMKRSMDNQKKELKESCDTKANKFLDSEGKKTYDELKIDAIEFIEDCIIKMFNYQMEASPEDKDRENYIQFKKVPSFDEKEFEDFSPLTENFGLYAKVIEIFFRRAAEWKRFLHDPFMKSNKKSLLVCKNLLYAVGARHAYYTHILWRASGSKIKLCKTDDNGNIFLPDHVCYPIQSGSLTCTSDADVGLIGRKAGDTARAYNEYIFNLQCGEYGNGKKRPCTPDVMMDNNVYAYSLQLATPELFVSNDDAKKRVLNEQKRLLQELDKNHRFQWLDILLAMMQLVRQRAGSFYEKFNEKIMSQVSDSSLSQYSRDFLDAASEGDLEENLKAYNELVSNIQANLDKFSSREDATQMETAVFLVLESHIKATESYHSFGALRTVVVTMQMKRPQMKFRLSLNDYIASAIENYGYAHANIMKCKQYSYQCLTDASKYLWRTFACLKAAKDVLVDIGQGESLSEDAKMNVLRARDYIAELFFIFKKNKKDVPLAYFSPVAYKELALIEEDGKESVKAKEIDSLELQKKFLKCETSVQCMNNIENMIIEYSKSMVRYQERNSEKHESVIDKPVNTHFFDYVTEASDNVVRCYIEYMDGKKDPCGIKSGAS